MEVYAAMIDHMDQGIGRIVAELKRQGRWTTRSFFFCKTTAAARRRRPEFNADEVKGKVFPPMRPDEIQTQIRRCRPAMAARCGTGPGVLPGRGYVRRLRLRLGERVEHAVPRVQALGARRRHQHAADCALAGWHPRSAAESCGNSPGHLIDLMATCVDRGRSQLSERRNGENIKPMEGVSLVRRFPGRDLAAHRTPLLGARKQSRCA